MTACRSYVKRVEAAINQKAKRGFQKKPKDNNIQLAQLNALERIASSIKGLLNVKRHQTGLPPLSNSNAVSEEVEEEKKKKKKNNNNNNNESPGPSTCIICKTIAGRKRSASGALKSPASKISKAAGKRKAACNKSPEL
ncbi:hypothetical protein K469DRAFT_689754 [Zopfia rhizophila CBS 207.26]|uniref:Uncharacterized protein n=1 Tax=Zopfia rhizophila CBS 207.26 TaxID=1314779 RepID=A0A6A6DX40_9PEZI|nr:hypothetical protein K469DRAFT_689754 [Zopfia rhizophila CBS 207.26]